MFSLKGRRGHKRKECFLNFKDKSKSRFCSRGFSLTTFSCFLGIFIYLNLPSCGVYNKRQVNDCLLSLPPEIYPELLSHHLSVFWLVTKIRRLIFVGSDSIFRGVWLSVKFLVDLQSTNYIDWKKSFIILYLPRMGCFTFNPVIKCYK